MGPPTGEVASLRRAGVCAEPGARPSGLQLSGKLEPGPPEEGLLWGSEAAQGEGSCMGIDREGGYGSVVIVSGWDAGDL